MTHPRDPVAGAIDAIEYALREDYSVNGIEVCKRLEHALTLLRAAQTGRIIAEPGFHTLDDIIDSLTPEQRELYEKKRQEIKALASPAQPGREDIRDIINGNGRVTHYSHRGRVELDEADYDALCKAALASCPEFQCGVCGAINNERVTTHAAQMGKEVEKCPICGKGWSGQMLDDAKLCGCGTQWKAETEGTPERDRLLQPQDTDLFLCRRRVSEGETKYYIYEEVGPYVQPQGVDVDLEALKRGETWEHDGKYVTDYSNGWNDCLDHLAANYDIVKRGEG